MLNLSRRYQFIIAVALMLLMVLTRGHHFASLNQLPSASWAIFFLAGLYFSGRSLFVVLLVEAALLDYIAITWGGVSSFCVSPAYVLLVPAYGVLWFAGRFFAKHYQFSLTGSLRLFTVLIPATATSQILSSGGFYLFSGRYTEPTLAEFAQRFVNYYPSQLSNIAFYLAIAAMIHILVVLLSNSESSQQSYKS